MLYTRSDGHFCVENIMEEKLIEIIASISNYEIEQGNRRANGAGKVAGSGVDMGHGYGAGKGSGGIRNTWCTYGGGCAEN